MEARATHLRLRLIVAVLITWAILGLGARLIRMNRRLFQGGIKGLTLYLVGDYAGAAQAYRAGFESLNGSRRDVFPTSPPRAESRTAQIEAALATGERALAEGRLEEASHAVSTALALDPNQFDALLLAAILETRADAVDAAIDWMKRALRSDVVTFRPSLFCAVLETVGQLRQRAAPKPPHCLLAHYYRYLRIFDEAHASAAIAHAKRAIAAHDRPDDAYVTIGAVSYRTYKPDDALRAVLKAVELNPRNAEALRWAAFLYFERGDTLNEYRMIKAAADAAPDDPFYLDHFQNLLLERLGDAPQALTVLQQAQQRHPDHPKLLERLGYVHGMLGAYGEAAEWYRRGLERHPADLELRVGLAFTLERQGHVEEAIIAYQQAVAVGPRQPDAHARLAGLYYGQRRYAEAIQEYELAVALGERNVARIAQWCMSYHLTSEFQRAADCFEAVLAQDPRHALANRMLPEVRNNLNSTTNAK